MFAYWVLTGLTVPPSDEPPFLIVFGDITMYDPDTPDEIARVFGDSVQSDVDAIAQWRRVSRLWNTWFLCSPRCWEPEPTDAQWAEAVGSRRVVHIRDEQRAVDYAMGLVARTWGHFADFRSNLAARQSAETVAELERQLERALG